MGQIFHHKHFPFPRVFNELLLQVGENDCISLHIPFIKPSLYGHAVHNSVKALWYSEFSIGGKISFMILDNPIKSEVAIATQPV